MHLHLVRHGPPLIDTSTPASTWPLDPDQSRAVEQLKASGALPAAARWFSSSEPKALQTAKLLSHDAGVTVLAELGEAVRPAGWQPRAEFEAAVSRSFTRPAEPALPGWEALVDVHARILRALDERVLPMAAGAGHDDVVLVGHGTAWTALVAALCSTTPDADAWRMMALPDHCVLELLAPGTVAPEAPGQRARVLRHWGDWRAGGGTGAA